MKIITDCNMVEVKLTKKPKKKKNNRWNKKYSKKYSITVPSATVIMHDDFVVCHPSQYRAVSDIFQKNQQLSMVRSFLD